ncbi:HAD-IA family hydrolase [Limimaricola pyoseonensis]|uniref:phosphoglycolate phosphatase n=1 Tax=Limimaricola pyoseonensis TaxID=521013 RepID=A0A1G6ZFB0_9RHOB|nr:HAD-IA family hydrolase [Limimaricola pyoseonensis]SDE00535.1 phosphoglycolate phosphatase [Limimaricola pyoseonensis]
MRTVIFDLDGTLAETSGDLIAAANRCFGDLGLGPLLDPREDAATAMHGARAMLRLGLSRVGEVDEQEIERQYPRLLAYYDEEIDRHSVLFPGAVEAVAELSRLGHPVGICTNKPEALAEKLLVRLGVRASFACLVGADTLAMRKPDPECLRETVRRAGGDPAHCVLVGDTETDRVTARAAGVPSILVAFGPNGHRTADLRPEALISHYDELVAAVQALG